MRKNIIRVGDRVKIINPAIFIRCGYPWDKQYVKDKIFTEKQKKDLHHLLESFGFSANRFDLSSYLNSGEKFTTERNEALYEKLLDELAYAALKKNGFGGKERMLFSKIRPEFLNKTGIVCLKKVVHTGSYIRGLFCEQEGDYIPAYIENRVVHSICSIWLDQGEEVKVHDTYLQKI